MTICIIGCTGFIGSHLSKNLSENGYKVLGVCRKFDNKNKILKKNHFCKIIQGDIRNKNTIKKIVNSKFSTIIYTISLNHKMSNLNLLNSFDINSIPLLSLCSNIVEKKKKKIRFIYFSTMQVYGDYQKMKTISENTQTNCQSPYALSHLVSENIIKSFSRINGFSSISIRLSNSYGYPLLHKNNSWGYVVNELCKEAILKSEINLLSDGSSHRDFVHISDVCHAIKKIIKIKKDIPETLNLSSGKTTNMMEVALKIKKYSSKLSINPIVYVKGKELKDSDINLKIKQFKHLKRFKISEKLNQKIGILNYTNLNDGIFLMLKEIKKNLKTFNKF
tara:strand:+ start:802 stop:1803 length:1002 start_codon:yes stop_codon:yes gene_type:complete